MYRKYNPLKDGFYTGNESYNKRLSEMAIADDKANEKNVKMIFERNAKKRTIKAKHEAFIKNVDHYLLTEAIHHLCKESASDLYNDDICVGFISKYVNENYKYIMNILPEKSMLTCEIANILEKCGNCIKDRIDEDEPLSFTIKPSENQQFHSLLANLDCREATKKINERIVKTTDEFIQKNVNDKLDLEEAAQKLKEKVDKAKSDSVKESYQREFARQLHLKKEKSNKNILEFMVHNMCANEVKVNLESYSTETVIESAATIYTVLETMNSLGICRKIDENFIKGLK